MYLASNNPYLLQQNTILFPYMGLLKTNETATVDTDMDTEMTSKVPA